MQVWVERLSASAGHLEVPGCCEADRLDQDRQLPRVHNSWLVLMIELDVHPPATTSNPSETSLGIDLWWGWRLCPYPVAFPPLAKDVTVPACQTADKQYTIRSPMTTFRSISALQPHAVCQRSP